MEFYFIDVSKFSITNFSYLDFDKIVSEFGYNLEKNKSLHNYFEWGNIKHWSLDYNLHDEERLSKIVSKSLNLNNINSPFFIRLKHHLPLIRIDTDKLISIFNDLYHENGDMGWEAISEDGRYILEVTDSYEHLVKSNFEIHSPPPTFVTHESIK